GWRLGAMRWRLGSQTETRCGRRLAACARIDAVSRNLPPIASFSTKLWPAVAVHWRCPRDPHARYRQERSPAPVGLPDVLFQRSIGCSPLQPGARAPAAGATHLQEMTPA